MVRIDCLTNKLGLSRCENNPGYVRLDQRDEKWREFTDEQGFFSPNKLAATSKGQSTNHAVPQLSQQGYKEGAWGVVFTGLVGGEGRQSEAAEVMDIESRPCQG